MSMGAWEETQQLVMRLLEDNAKDVKEIKQIISTEFRDIRGELKEAIDGHKKENASELEKLKDRVASQDTEIALLKQKFILIGSGAGAIAAIIADAVRAALTHH